MDGIFDNKKSRRNSTERTRTIIYAYSALVGIIAGGVIVGYREAIELLEGAREKLLPFFVSSIPRLMLWLGITALLGLATALMVRRSPLIKGSGIPQVKAFLMRRVDFDWKRELPFKFLGGVMALGTGLSLGREGPSIQLGALAGTAVADVSGRKDFQRYLVTAGAAAGISAAFNAPLAAVLFCVEELHRNFSPVMLTSSLIASFSANAVMWAFFGNATVFDITLVETLPLGLYFPAVLTIGIAAGIAGGVFNRGILLSQSLYKRLVPDEIVRIVSAFAAAALVALVFPAITGGGHHLVGSLLSEHHPLAMVAALFAGKLLFTLFCYASGTPGGIFLPLLGIGALLGALCEFLFIAIGLPDHHLANYIIIGMVGFFTAVVRAPITGAVLITEMAGSFAHFPALILVSVTASLVSSIMRTRPIYDSLLEQLKPDHQAKPDTSPITLEIPVMEGSFLDTAARITESLPDGCILVAVERGDGELFPDGNADIHPGDVLKIVVERGRARELKEKLLGLGRSSSANIEYD
jgi:H+/Cl- antiporter ClcA